MDKGVFDLRGASSSTLIFIFVITFIYHFFLSIIITKFHTWAYERIFVPLQVGHPTLTVHSPQVSPVHLSHYRSHGPRPITNRVLVILSINNPHAFPSQYKIHTTYLAKQ